MEIKSIDISFVTFTQFSSNQHLLIMVFEVNPKLTLKFVLINNQYFCTVRNSFLSFEKFHWSTSDRKVYSFMKIITVDRNMRKLTSDVSKSNRLPRPPFIKLPIVIWKYVLPLFQLLNTVNG